MRNRNNVLVGAPEIKAAGGFQVGKANPAKADYPTDAAAQPKSSLNLAAAGFISEDGVSKTIDRSTDKIKDWNGDTMIVTQSDHSVTISATFCEAANAEVLKMIAGDENVEVNGGNIVVADTADELPHRCLWIDIRGSATAKVRLFVPDAQVTEVGDVTYVKGDVIKYEVTFECFSDEDGKKLIQFIERANAEVTDGGQG